MSDFAVNVRFFASLRERVGVAEKRLTVADGATIADVWALAVPDAALSGRVLVARNQEYSSLDQAVAAGDEIAFFPPVTGG
jgi:molybdopterin synthase sulfur carrier subunit